MRVYQIRVKLFFLKGIPVNDIQARITELLDTCLLKSRIFSDFHKANQYKYYCMDRPYPIEEDKLYKKESIYTLTVRTIDPALAEFFSGQLPHTETSYLKGLTTELKLIPEKILARVFTLTPAILKSEQGYWRGRLPFEVFEERLKSNLVKKWNYFQKEKLDENFTLYHRIEFLNKMPIPTAYKNIKLLGDKFCLYPDESEAAQRLAYMSLGTGLLEANSRGFGFAGYRWL